MIKEKQLTLIITRKKIILNIIQRGLKFWSLIHNINNCWLSNRKTKGLLNLIRGSIFDIFCLHFVHREKNISRLFICKYWCFLSHFPCLNFVHWSTGFSNFATFFSFVLISCKKSRNSWSRVCDPSEHAQRSFRTKKTMWKMAGVFRKKN